MKRWFSVCWLGVAGVIVVAAVLVSLTRLVVPVADRYREALEQSMSGMVGHQVTIGAMQTRWGFGHPRTDLTDVVVQSLDDPDNALHFGHIEIRVDVLSSLFSGALRLASATIYDTEIYVLRQEDGSFRVRGAGLGADQQATVEGGDILTLLRGARFRLTDSRLRWEDRLGGHDYRFENVDLAVAIGRRSEVTVAGEVALPEGIGLTLSVGLELTGDLARPGGWNARVYARGDDVRLDVLSERMPDIGVRVVSGIADFEHWSVWRAGRMVSLSGHQELRDLEAVGAAIEGEPLPVAAQQVSGRFRWDAIDDGWRLDVADLGMRRGGREWSGGEFSLAYAGGADGEAERGRLRGGMAGLRIEDLLPFVLLYPGAADAAGPALMRLVPAGRLDDLRFHALLPAAGLPYFTANGEFAELAIAAWPGAPGFQGLAGRFSLDGRSGELVLDSHGVRVDFPRLFEDALWIDELAGEVAWTFEDGRYRLRSDAFSARNQDLDVQGRVALEVGGGRSGEIDLQLGFRDGNGANTALYLPVGILPKTTHQWLVRSIVDARVSSGGMLLKGRFADFPFRHDEGVFEVRAQIEDGTLDYMPGWPRMTQVAGELVFRNQGMRAENVSGRIFGTEIRNAWVGIENLNRPRLLIRGSTAGPLADLLRYLEDTPLVPDWREVLAAVQVSGDAELDLDIGVHLNARDPLPSTVAGDLTFHHNLLAFPDYDLAFDAIEGGLRFTDHTLRARGVGGRFHGYALSLDGERAKGGATVLDAEARLGVDALAAWLPDGIEPHLEGASRWRARLIIPPSGPRRTDGETQLRLESDLIGVRSALPEPFAKAADDLRAFRADLLVGHRFQAPMRFRLGDEVSAVMQLRDVAGSLAIDRAELRIDAGTAELPLSGISMVGRLPRLSVSEWERLAAASSAAPAIASAGGLGASLQRVDVQLGELELRGNAFHQVSLRAERGGDRWRAEVQAREVGGRIDLPHEPAADRPLALDLDYLHLPRSVIDGDGDGDGDGLRRAPDPRDLPPIRLNARAFTLGEETYRNLRLDTDRLPDGMRIAQLGFGSDVVSAQASGDWTVDAAGVHQTRARAELTFNDLGQALTNKGFKHGFARGRGSVQGDFRWPDVPMRFTLDGLEGEAHIDLRDGRLIEVDPGAGRFIGLFSLQALPRRLALDFRDFFQQGLAYDHIRGDLNFRGADVYTSNLVVDGPSSAIRIEGRTGIGARDYDHRVTVVPSVTSTLPIAGAVLGGPVAGAAIFLIDRLLGIGKQIDESARIEYHVTGSWDEPVIEVVDPQPAKTIPEP